MNILYLFFALCLLCGELVSKKAEIWLTPVGHLVYSYKLRGNNSAVECNLAKVEVAGSNPVSRSTPEFNRPRKGYAIFRGFLVLLPAHLFSASSRN